MYQKENNRRASRVRETTGKSMESERHMTAPEIRLVLKVGFDPSGYFLGGFNLFKLAIWL